jgi:hypothetical protein
MSWQVPSLSLKWGPYNKPEPEEQLKTMQVVQQGLGGAAGKQVFTLQMGIEKLRQEGVIDVDNIEALIEQIEKERDEQAERELDAATAALAQTGQGARAPGAVPPARGGAPAAPRDSRRTPSGQNRPG